MAAPAMAISRSGGGKLESADLGFSASAPEAYPRANPISNQGLRLWSGMDFGGSDALANSFLEIRAFGGEFSNLISANRSATSIEFSRIGWLKNAHSDLCIDVFERDSATIHSVAIIWGSGRGIIVLGGLSKLAKDSVDEIVSTVTLLPKSCGW